MSFLKTIVRSSAHRNGYEIRKFPSLSFAPVPVFDMAVQLLMATRGERVKFIQVGANDGDFGDPLRKYILKFPWSGILVEPQADVFRKLRENYAAVAGRLIFENVAVASGQSAITMYRAANGGAGLGQDTIPATPVVSAVRSVTAKQLGIRPQDLEAFSVPCVTLDELVAKHGLSHFDVLQIDTEGYDWQVLQTLDLAKARPSIIQFEHGHLSRRDIDSAIKLLTLNEYKVHWGGYQTDTVALHADFLRS